MKAVIYTRYSPGGKQNDKSTEGQLRECYLYCEKNDITVIAEYNDKKITGRYDTRPEFQRLISDAAKMHFTHVIVWQLDRFARNRFDSAVYKSQLRKHGVRVISATEPISDNPEGIILEGMLEAMAEYYSANLSRNVKRGLREAAIAGTYVGGVIPLGYKVVNKKLVEDETKSHIVKYAMDQYAAGIGKKEVVDDLNGRGYRNAQGKPFVITSLESMLRNKKYIGVYEFNGAEVTGGCPALIDKAVFDKVQERVKIKKHAPARGTGRVVYHLQGKAYCGLCGARLVGDAGTSRQGIRHNYYSCGSRKKYHNCTKATEKKDFLEWYVVEQTIKYILQPERLPYIADIIVNAYKDEFSGDKIANLEKRISKIDGDINKAVDASIEAPAAARKKYYDKIELLETERLDVEIDLSRLKIAASSEYTHNHVIAWLKSFCNGDPLDTDFQRRIIDVFINSVYLYDDRIVLYYNIRDGQQVSYIEMLDSTSDPPDGDVVQNSTVMPHHKYPNDNS